MNRENKKNHWIIFSILLLVLLIPVSAFAQGSGPTDDDVNAVAKQLFCPVCENIPLDACGTQACEQWRGIIRDRLKDGWTEEQIKDYFVAQYGDRVLAEPPRRGFNWVVYIVPIVIFVGGGFLFYRGFKQWRSSVPDRDQAREGKKPSAPGKPSEEDIRRVEEELLKRAKD